MRVIFYTTSRPVDARDHDLIICGHHFPPRIIGLTLPHLLKCLHYCFEVLSGLSSNINKSFIYPIAVPDEGIEATVILHCHLGEFPFTFLGPLIKPSSLSRRDWQTLLDYMDWWLAAWKGTTLSCRAGLSC